MKHVPVLAIALLAPLAALADPLPVNTGIYLENTDGGRGSADYASSNSVTIYSNGGATQSGAPTYQVTQTPTALGALSGVLSSRNDDGTPNGNSGTLSASANLATSTVGGLVTGNQRGLTTSLLNDVLTFHVAGGGSAEVGFGMQLAGNITGDGGKATQLVLDFDFSNVDLYQYIWSDGRVDPGYVGSGGAISNLQSSFGGDGNFAATGDYLVTDGDSRRLQFALYLDCQGTAITCDFTNAGHFVLDLPDGVTVTSSSGTVYGVDVSAVPEPANAALMLASVFALAGVAVRRRRQDVLARSALA